MTRETIDDAGGRIIERLQAALRSDGDFPVRAKVVTDLRIRAGKPTTTVDQIAELILKEPALGTRVLHIVNSAFYQRAKAVETISQAVIRLGMTAISDLCAGLVLMQKFVPAARRGGIFADCVKRNIVTALISNDIARQSRDQEVAEKGYLAGTFYHLGHLLLAFYFPQVYEAAGKRAQARGYDISRSISEVLGRNSVEMVLAIVDALQIPEFYREVLKRSALPKAVDGDGSTVDELAAALQIAGALSEAIVDLRSREALESAIRRLSHGSIETESLLVDTVRRLPESFKQHCQFIELGFLTLPDFVEGFSVGGTSSAPERSAVEGEAVSPSYNLGEIRQAVTDGEPLSSVLALVLEELTTSLGYDRALFLEVDEERTELIGKLSVGREFPVDPQTIRRCFRDLNDDAPDYQAFTTGLPVIFGEALFADGWPFAAFPAGSGERAKGVIYADRLQKSNEPLDGPAQAVLTLLTELLERAVEQLEDW